MKMPKWKFNKVRFIERLRETGSIKKAAKWCRVDKKTPFHHRWHDPEFDAAWRNAVAEYKKAHPFVSKRKPRDYKKDAAKRKGEIRIKVAKILSERTGWYVRARKIVSYSNTAIYRPALSWSVIGTRPNAWGRRSKVVFFSPVNIALCRRGVILSWEGKQIKVIPIKTLKGFSCSHDFNSARKDVCFICGFTISQSAKETAQPVEPQSQTHKSAEIPTPSPAQNVSPS